MLVSKSLYSYPLQKADVLALVRDYLVDMQGEARNKYTTSSLDDQRNRNRQNSSKQHKNGITGPCSTFTLWFANAKDDNVLLHLLNPLLFEENGNMSK